MFLKENLWEDKNYIDRENDLYENNKNLIQKKGIFIYIFI